MPLTFSHPKPSNLYKFIAIVITLCLLEGCTSRAETQLAAPKPDPAKTQEALGDAERLFAQRSDIGNLRKAVSIVASVRNPDYRNYEVEWTFAKYCYFLGKVEKDQEKAAEIFEKGRDAARIASRVEPERPDGHFWFAANLGELSRMSPLTVGLKSVDELRNSMEKVIVLEPGYQGASAYDALGQLEIATRNFRGGKTEKAVEYYEKGIALAPDNSSLRLHLAEALFALKRDAAARKQIDEIIAMKPNPEYVAEHQLAIEKARELLSKNF
jgi:tetratricopeptide (TPR) repeat protein